MDHHADGPFRQTLSARPQPDRRRGPRPGLPGSGCLSRAADSPGASRVGGPGHRGRVRPKSSHRRLRTARGLTATPCPCSTANRAPPVSTSYSVFRSGSRHHTRRALLRAVSRDRRSMTAGNRGCSSSRSSPSPTKSPYAARNTKPTPPGETTPSLSTLGCGHAADWETISLSAHRARMRPGQPRQRSR